MEEIRLSRHVTIKEYQRREAARDRERIATFILERFSERYIKPLRTPETHGFCIMAICCLMIEALESFWQGWTNTKGCSKKAFISFFKRCQEQELDIDIREFSSLAEDFYENVRCGILHQAETTNGWRISRERDGKLFERTTKTINAELFLDQIEEALNRYCQTLRDSDWDDEVWTNLRKKMAAIIRNCQIGESTSSYPCAERDST